MFISKVNKSAFCHGMARDTKISIVEVYHRVIEYMHFIQVGRTTSMKGSPAEQDPRTWKGDSSEQDPRTLKGDSFEGDARMGKGSALAEDARTGKGGLLAEDARTRKGVLSGEDVRTRQGGLSEENARTRDSARSLSPWSGPAQIMVCRRILSMCPELPFAPWDPLTMDSQRDWHTY
ncbi:hypothetical protein K438DRAFT_1872999 [Mycena galopus ATCC 62051]|nr:hypothetical protein K438DRAFT_1872999 [Mycena galopus ATCC 62051]